MKKKCIYIQDSVSSCGSECIRSVVSFYDGYVPLEMVLEDTMTDKSGTNAYEIVTTLKKYGFDSYGAHVSLEEIDNEKLPVIAHVIKGGYEHFVVIYQILKNKVVVMDPECGKRKYDKDVFNGMFDEKAIFMTPNGEIIKIDNSHSLLYLLTPIAKKHIKLFLVCTIMSIIVIAFSLLSSFHIKLLDASLNPLFITGVLIALKVFVAGLIYIKTNLQIKLSEYVDKHSFQTFTSHIFKLPIRYLKNKRVGEIVQKIEDMSRVKDLFIKVFLTSFIDLLLFILALILMMNISSKLTIIYVFVIILYTLIVLLFKRVIYKSARENTERYEEYTGALVEYLSGIESIKNLSAEEKFLNKLGVHLNNFIGTNATNYRKETAINLFKNNVLEIGSLIVTLVGFMMIGENFDLMDLLTFESLFSLLYSSCENLVGLWSDAFKSKVINRNISEFLDVKEERTLGRIDGEFKTLKTRGLTYSYDHLHNIIERLDFTLRKGEKVLLNGPSGAGKSTLVKCLAGRLENYNGSIYINGEDIKTISVQSLREHIIYVGQEEHLFRASIRENITLGDYDEERFRKVSSITKVDEILNHRADREHTVLLEGASNISGGEKARIILARALYKNPSVLIIDETLSSVSGEMEDEIILRLKELENLSVLYITHRDKRELFEKVVRL